MLELNPQKVVHIIYLFREAERRHNELYAFIDGMNDDEKAHLTALAWIGRGAFEASDFDEAVATAYSAVTVPTADFLMGMPHLAENLENGMEAMGIDVVGQEADFLDGDH